MLGADAPPYDRQQLISTVRDIVQRAWSQRVVCDCMASNTRHCGHCRTPVTKLWGTFWSGSPQDKDIEPSAVTADTSVHVDCVALVVIHHLFKELCDSPGGSSVLSVSFAV